MYYVAKTSLELLVFLLHQVMGLEVSYIQMTQNVGWAWHLPWTGQARYQASYISSLRVIFCSSSIDSFIHSTNINRIPIVYISLPRIIDSYKISGTMKLAIKFKNIKTIKIQFLPSQSLPARRLHAVAFLTCLTICFPWKGSVHLFPDTQSSLV